MIFFSTDYFRSIQSTAVVEREAAKNRTIHCHALSCKGSTLVPYFPLIMTKIRATVVNAMGLGNIHMKKTLYRNANDTFRKLFVQRC
jgi:hypothetical protein